MDKETFKVIVDFYNAENEAEIILSEKGLSHDEIDEVLNPFTTLCEKLLKIGKYTVKEEYIGEDTYLKQDYENLKKYTKLTVFYEYDNGMTLCETTSSLFYLIPKELLDKYEEYEEALLYAKYGEAVLDVPKDDANEEHVVSYWSLEDDIEHVIFCSNRYEAEQKAKELEESGIDFDDIDIMTRETYDEAELESIEDEYAIGRGTKHDF